MYEEMEDKYIQPEKIREKEKKFWNTEDSGKEEGNKTKEILQDTYALIEEERPVFRPPFKGISKILTTASPRLAVKGAWGGYPGENPKGTSFPEGGSNGGITGEKIPGNVWGIHYGT